MNHQGNPYLNKRALLSPLGAARTCQLALGCAAVAMVTHAAGYSGSHGAFCMAVWCLCFGATTLVFFLDATRLHGYLPVSWENLTVAFAALATLMYVTASVVYPLYSVTVECPYAGCHVRDFRIAVTCCSVAGTLAYGAEVVLSRARPGQTAVGYMATAPGLLKVVQGFVACIIFGALGSGSEFARSPATVYCVAVYAACFALTGLVVALTVSGRTAALRCAPFERLVAVYTLAAVLLYLSAAVTWAVLCFDPKYGSPRRPASCPRGECSWDSQLAVAVSGFVNLGLYAADLAYAQRLHLVSPQPGRPRV